MPSCCVQVEEKEKSRGLPVKTLDGQLVFERDDEGKRKGPRRAAALQELAKASQAIQVCGDTATHLQLEQLVSHCVRMSATIAAYHARQVAARMVSIAVSSARFRSHASGMCWLTY
jgi:hypothetical protein